MTIKQPFFPHYGANQVVTPAAASASVSISLSAKQLRVLNPGAAIGHFRTYNSDNGAQNATTADYPVPPGSGAIVSKQGHNAIAFISATGTTFHIMPGEGF